jgi:hypothetical protein
MKTHETYREFTFGWLVFAFVIPTYALMIYLYVNGLGDRPFTPGLFILVSAVMVIACLLFSSMTTTVSDEKVVVSFGIGLIRKRIPLSRIMGAETVRSPLYYGWGIRLIPNGMMYNISGSYAVELTFNDSDRIFRIGSKKPSALREEILKRIDRKVRR